MVYIDDWETFYNESEKLYTEHPAHVRPAHRPAPTLAGLR